MPGVGVSSAEITVGEVTTSAAESVVVAVSSAIDNPLDLERVQATEKLINPRVKQTTRPTVTQRRHTLFFVLLMTSSFTLL
jgi:hypothetical protein